LGTEDIPKRNWCWGYDQDKHVIREQRAAVYRAGGQHRDAMVSASRNDCIAMVTPSMHLVVDGLTAMELSRIADL
jgi:hypothetical protein